VRYGNLRAYLKIGADSRMGEDNCNVGRDVQCPHQGQIALLLNTSKKFRTILLDLFSVRAVSPPNKYGVWMDGMNEVSQLAPITCLFSVFRPCEMTVTMKMLTNSQYWWSQVCIVGEATRLLSGQSRVRIPTGERYLSRHRNIKTDSEAHPFS
jgi:hypothetical protein